MASTRAWVLGGIAVAAAGVGLVRLLTDRPRIGPESRVLLVGDSHAQGLAPHLRAIAKEEGIPFEALYRVGSRADEWAADPALAAAVEAFAPTLVIVSLGTNDAYFGDVAERQGPAIDEIVGLAEGAGAEVVWVSPLELGPYRGVEPDYETRTVIEEHAPHVFASDELDIDLGPDGLHATAAGYGAWAGALWSWLTP